jgi:glycine/D-amino acid oxidase-like deaminating enzyme
MNKLHFVEIKAIYPINFRIFVFMQTQVIIVGFGIAGANLCFALQKKGIDFIVIDEPREVTSSKVAAGLYNPVTGKRVVKTWMADDIFPYANLFYKEIEEQLNITIRYDRKAFRIYKDVSDQNDILTKAYDQKYKGYLNVDYQGEEYDGYLQENMGGIEVLQSGNLDINTYLNSFQKSLEQQKRFISKKFYYDKLAKEGENIAYQGITSDKIIFCEGFRGMYNPFFEWLPYAVTKGEMLRISCNLPRTHILNKGFFILPDKDNETFIVGSSYERVINEELSEKGRLIVSDKLDTLLQGDYKIVGQYAAVRPTVRDRRPFIGEHPELTNHYSFNGMGTKGVTLSPFFANQFVHHLYEEGEINKEANISRYFSLYFKSQKNHPPEK